MTFLILDVDQSLMVSPQSLSDIQKGQKIWKDPQTSHSLEVNHTPF
jgi:hypothetical protein